MAAASRPLRRKTSHSVIEKRRREKINEGLISLQKLVPACRLELKELLDCKVQNVKSSIRLSKEDLQAQSDRLFDEKVGSQMVLEKLCIISHTVDYVQELQDKLQAYKRMFEISPDMPKKDLAKAHDSAHMTEVIRDTPRSSKSGHISLCQECAVMSQGKRHWGSNNPIHLSRQDTLKRKRLSSQDLVNIKEDNELIDEEDEIESDSDPSYLELDDWHGNHTTYCSHLYTNNAPLGLLAHVSEELQRCSP